MNFHIVIVLSIIVLLSGYSIAQSESPKAVAKVGNVEISADEFLERYELSPQVSAGVKGAEESLKNELIYSMIAEKLWALEAESSGISDSDIIKYTYKAYEKMYVRDALYRREITDKIKITDAELKEAKKRDSKILMVNYLFSKDQSEIEQLFEYLKKGASFDSLLSVRPEFSLQKNPYIVKYGQMKKEVEDKLYSLKIGEYTKPENAPNGWYIFKLIGEEENTIGNEQQAEAEQKRVLKVIKTTQTDSIYNIFIQNFFKDVDTKVDRQLFEKFSDAVINMLSQRKKNQSIPDSEQIFLDASDLETIGQQLGEDELNSAFIQLDDKPATLNEVLQQLAFENFSVDSISTLQIKLKLNSFIKKFVEQELLSREGYRRGLENLPDVQHELNMWKSYYLSDALRNEELKNIHITDEEAYDYFLKNNQDQKEPDSSFKKVREKIKSQLKYGKFSDLVISKTIELANKYGFTVNKNLLKSLTVMNITNVVYRYFGFGGRVLAVPMTIPNYLWKAQFDKQSQLSP